MCILNNTNKYAEEFVLDKDVADKKLYEKTNMIELRAFLGILIIMGIYRDTKEDLDKNQNEKPNIKKRIRDIGILIIMAISRDTKEDLRKLWHVASGRGIY